MNLRVQKHQAFVTDKLKSQLGHLITCGGGHMVLKVLWLCGNYHFDSKHLLTPSTLYFSINKDLDKPI